MKRNPQDLNLSPTSQKKAQKQESELRHARFEVAGFELHASTACEAGRALLLWAAAVREGDPCAAVLLGAAKSKALAALAEAAGAPRKAVAV